MYDQIYIYAFLNCNHTFYLIIDIFGVEALIVEGGITIFGGMFGFSLVGKF